VPRVQARPRMHRIKAPWLALPLRPVAALGQDEEPGMCGGEARGRGRLGPMMSSINDVANLYDEFEETFVDVMTALGHGRF
jgi:hypothetical protein